MKAKKILFGLLVCIALLGITACQKTGEGTLAFIAVDPAGAKVDYVVGETINYDNLKVYGVYSNDVSAMGAQLIDSDYSTKVVNGDGKEVTTFDKAGVYTVIVTAGEKQDTYSIEVTAPDLTSVSDAINKGVANGGKVNEGHIILSSLNSMLGETEPTSTDYDYAYGNDYFTFSNLTSRYSMWDDSYSLNSTDVYISKVDDESVFAALIYDGWEFSLMEGADSSVIDNISLLDGFDYALTSYDANYHYYGTENLVKGLYDLAVENNATVTENVTDGIYSYSYSLRLTHADYGVTYDYDIAVSFDLSDYYHISSADVEISRYLLETEVDENGDTVYDENYNPVYTGNRGELATINTYSITQQVGDRNVERKYDQSNLLFESFDLIDADGNVVAPGEITLTSGENPHTFTVSNPIPTTASTKYDAISLVATDEFGAPLLDEWGWELNFAAIDWLDANNINIYAQIPGKYLLTVSTAKVTKEYTITVVLGAPTSLTAEYLKGSDWMSADAYSLTPGETLNVKVNAGKYVDGSYTIACSEGLTAIESSVDGVACYELTASETGEYTITYISIANPELSIVVPVTVKEAVNLSVVGTYNGADSYGDPIVLVMNADGTASINDYFGFGNYTYTVDGSTINLVHTSGYNHVTGQYYALSFNSDGNVDINVMNNLHSTLVKEAASVVGTYNGADSYGDPIVLVLNDDGSATITDYYGEGSYTYTVDGSAINLVHTSGYNHVTGQYYTLSFNSDGNIDINVMNNLHSTLTKAAGGSTPKPTNGPDGYYATADRSYVIVFDQAAGTMAYAEVSPWGDTYEASYTYTIDALGNIDLTPADPDNDPIGGPGLIIAYEDGNVLIVDPYSGPIATLTIG